MFIGTGLLAKAFQSHVNGVAKSAFAAAEVDIGQGNPESAIAKYRTALVYDRENKVYEFRLGTALVAAHHDQEAQVYLRNLWEREPGNAFLNLQLARLAARSNTPDSARQYYRGAVYGTWDADPQAMRRQARMEFAGYLLSRGDKRSADAELLAALPELPDDDNLRKDIAALLLAANDAEKARELYREVLGDDKSDQVALTGAGKAAFALGEYREAANDLERLKEQNDESAVRMLELSKAVTRLNPYAARVGFRERISRTLRAFIAAGERLEGCVTKNGTNQPEPLRNAVLQWNGMKPQVTEKKMRNEPDTIDDAMAVVFSVERTATQVCGENSIEDEALLLIAKQHEGTER